jgi:hypothetical protein
VKPKRGEVNLTGPRGYPGRGFVGVPFLLAPDSPAPIIPGLHRACPGVLRCARISDFAVASRFTAGTSTAEVRPSPTDQWPKDVTPVLEAGDGHADPGVTSALWSPVRTPRSCRFAGRKVFESGVHALWGQQCQWARLPSNSARRGAGFHEQPVNGLRSRSLGPSSARLPARGRRISP